MANETEYTVVKVNRMEAGSDSLPVEHPRRCRYYVRALNRKAAELKIAERWPNEQTAIVSTRDVPVRVFPAEKKAAAPKAQTGSK